MKEPDILDRVSIGSKNFDLKAALGFANAGDTCTVDENGNVVPDSPWTEEQCKE